MKRYLRLLITITIGGSKRESSASIVFNGYLEFEEHFMSSNYRECDRIAQETFDKVEEVLRIMTKARRSKKNMDAILDIDKIKDTYIAFHALYENGTGILAEFEIIPDQTEGRISRHQRAMEKLETMPQLSTTLEDGLVEIRGQYNQIIYEGIESDPERVRIEFENVRIKYSSLKRVQKKMGNSITMLYNWVDMQIKNYKSRIKYLIPLLPSFKQELEAGVRKKFVELKEESEEDTRDIDQLAAECKLEDKPAPKAKSNAGDKRRKRQQEAAAAASRTDQANVVGDESDVGEAISQSLEEIIQEYWNKFRDQIVSEEVEEGEKKAKGRIDWSKTLQQFLGSAYAPKSDESFPVAPHLIPCAEPYKYLCPISVSYANLSSNDPNPISAEIQELWKKKGVKTIVKGMNHCKEDFALGIAVLSSSNKLSGNTLHNVDLTLTNHQYAFKRCAVNGLLTLLIDKSPDKASIVNYVEYVLDAIINNDSPEATVAKLAYMQKFERKFSVTETMDLIRFFKSTVLDLLEDKDDAIDAALSYHMPRKNPLTSSLGEFTVCNHISEVLDPAEENKDKKLIFIGHGVPSQYINTIPTNDLGFISYDKMKEVVGKLQAQGPHILVSPMDDAFTLPNTTSYLGGNMHSKMLKAGPYTLVTSWNIGPVDPKYERVESVVLIKNDNCIDKQFDEWIRIFEANKKQLEQGS